MEILTSFAAPGHNPWDALIVLLIVGGILALAHLGRRDQAGYGEIRAAHAAAALQATPDQALAIAALGPVPAPRRLGLFLALLVASLALAGGARRYYADLGKECSPACISPQVCRGGICTGTADARIFSMLYPLPNVAARELGGTDDADRRAPLPEPRHEPAALEISFGAKQ